MKTVIKTSNLWRKPLTLKRCRTLETVFAGIALLILESGLAAKLQTAATATKQTDICYTADCLRTASTVLGKMNTEIRPCEDFYQFACGSFINETQLTKDKEFVTTISDLADRVQEQLQAIMKEQRPEMDPKHLKLPSKLYRACTNTDLIETLGPKPMQRIAKKLGGWPVTDCDCWNRNNTWTWQKTVKKFRRFGFNSDYIVRLSIDVNSNNTNKRIINLDPSLLGFGQSILAKGFTSPLVSIYYDYMVDIAVLFGAEKGTAKKQLRKSLQFEMNLANISTPRFGKRKSKDMYNLLSIEQMQKTYPYINWLDYINGLLPKGLSVKEDEIINVSDLSFFEKLGKVIEQTEKRDIANYLMWRAHEYSAEFLSKEFRERKSQYQTALRINLKQESQPEDCVKTVLRRLPISMDSLFMRKHFKPDSKLAVLEMINYIRHVFRRVLDETQWMDYRTTQRAKNKFNLMTHFIGYPDELLDDNKLEEYYRKLHIDPDKYFKSSLRKNVFDTDESLNQLKFPVDASNWKTYLRPAVINGFFTHDKNNIKLSAGILQGHFFNIHHPMYMNFGAIGFVIGHEISHGFVGRGSQYDSDGYSYDWWENETRIAYKEKAQCFIIQYGNYTEKQTGLNINGDLTQEENISDHGGIKASYLAYKEWVARNGEEYKLPGLNYTSQQMFWLLAAQNQCAKYSKDHTEFQITYNTHALPESRILVTFSNMKDFSFDFQCANGTRMNPVHKCEIL